MTLLWERFLLPHRARSGFEQFVASVLTRRHGHQLMMMVTLKLLQDIPGDMQRHLVAGLRSR